MSAIVADPAFLSTWAVLLLTWTACAVWLLRTDVGQQALVDERVRAVEAFGGRVDDAAYAAWQARPPLLGYFTSGGRLLLNPGVTLAVAGGLFLWARRAGRPIRPAVATAIAVHATTVLVLQQVVATPVAFVRESLASTTNLAALVPVADEGTVMARLLGAIDVFGVWWVCLMAIGAGAATGHGATRPALLFVAVYVVGAAVIAAALAVAGGS
jgi:hypothetical protein